MKRFYRGIGKIEYSHPGSGTLRVPGPGSARSNRHPGLDPGSARSNRHPGLDPGSKVLFLSFPTYALFKKPKGRTLDPGSKAGMTDRKDRNDGFSVLPHSLFARMTTPEVDLALQRSLKNRNLRKQ